MQNIALRINNLCRECLRLLDCPGKGAYDFYINYNVVVNMSVMQVDAYPEQETRGSKVEGARYTSKDFALAEWEGMWTKVWLLLGRESEMPNPGDWQMEEVGPESILMVRQTDD
ncbi:MAG: hypothetical protein HON77_07820, partial [Gammaproteobacteria bacterium]|nr:hypothetical protein [Gammaproteobacteria bacterium]